MHCKMLSQLQNFILFHASTQASVSSLIRDIKPTAHTIPYQLLLTAKSCTGCQLQRTDSLLSHDGCLKFS